MLAATLALLLALLAPPPTIGPRVSLAWSTTRPGVATLQASPGPETRWLCAYKQSDHHGHVFLGCTREPNEALSLTLGPGGDQAYIPRADDAYYVTERTLSDDEIEVGPLELPEPPVILRTYLPFVPRSAGW